MNINFFFSFSLSPLSTYLIRLTSAKLHDLDIWMSAFPSTSNANEVRKGAEGIPWCDIYFMKLLHFFSLHLKTALLSLHSFFLVEGGEKGSGINCALIHQSF